MRAFRKFAMGSAVLGVLLGIVIGLPLLLWLLIGWPLPEALPTWTEFSAAVKQNGVPDAALLDAIAVICWLLWATFTVSLVAEAIAATRGRVVRRVVLLSPVQLLAAALVSTLVVSFASNGKPAPVIPIDSYVVAMQPASLVAPAPTTEAPEVVLADTSSPTLISYTVVRRDTLWGISQRHLGDPTRWKEIYSLNKDKPQPDGRSLTDADMIRPGWILQLPSDASGIVSQAAPVVVPSPVVEVPTVPPTPTISVENPNTTVANAGTTTTTVGMPQTADTVEVSNSEVSAKDGVSLASTSIVPVSLIVGIGAAVASLRLRRRARRSLSDPMPGVSWSEPLIDDTVREVRRHDLDHQLSSLGLSDESEDSYIPARPSALDVIASSDVDVRPHNEVRAIVVDAITDTNCEVVIAGLPLAEALIGGSGSFEGLSICDQADALRLVDESILSRARTLQDAELEDMASYRQAFPGEPMSTKLFVFGGDDLERIRDYADRARNYDVVLVMTDVEMETLDLREDISVNEYSLNVVEAKSMVDVVRTSRVDEEAIEDAPVEPFVVPPSSVDSIRPIQISIFGPVRIVARGEEIKNGLRGKVRELLAFLAMRPQGATWDVIGAALWPEANGKQANERFRTTLSRLRATLRASTASDAKFVDLIGERYVLDPSLFDCDVWRFQSSLTEAVSDSANAKGALQRVADCYGGELAEGSYYEWAEAPREDLRRRVLDALGRLAELHQRDGNATAALSALERAISLDPYVEEVYQRVMAIQAEAGRPDAVVRTYRLLERRLNEIDVEPTETTMALLRESAA